MQLARAAVKKLVELESAAVEFTQTNLFQFSPAMSYPRDEWVTADPESMENAGLPRSPLPRLKRNRPQRKLLLFYESPTSPCRWEKSDACLKWLTALRRQLLTLVNAFPGQIVIFLQESHLDFAPSERSGSGNHSAHRAVRSHSRRRHTLRSLWHS